MSRERESLPSLRDTLGDVLQNAKPQVVVPPQFHYTFVYEHPSFPPSKRQRTGEGVMNAEPKVVPPPFPYTFVYESPPSFPPLKRQRTGERVTTTDEVFVVYQEPQEPTDWRIGTNVPVDMQNRERWRELIESRRRLQTRSIKSKEYYKELIKSIIEEYDLIKDKAKRRIKDDNSRHRRDVLAVRLKREAQYYALDGHMTGDNALEEFVQIFGNSTLYRIKGELGVTEPTVDDVLDYQYLTYETALDKR